MESFPLQSYLYNNSVAEIPTLEEVFFSDGFIPFQTGSADEPRSLIEELEKMFEQNSTVYSNKKRDQLIELRDAFIRIVTHIDKEIEKHG
jgi:hypothetical protein